MSTTLIHVTKTDNELYILAIQEGSEKGSPAGLYELQHEQRINVTDTFDSGPECLTTAKGWRGTRVPRLLASRLAATQVPVTVVQEVRLRALRRAT